MFQRNVYLQRTHSSTPHSYSYDMQTGKYYIEHSGNTRELIERTGRLPTKFKPNGSGFFTAKRRYQQAQTDKSAMHFVPEATYNRHKSLYTPITDKFMGYAQFPYKADMPDHLELPHAKASKIINFEQQVQANRQSKHQKHLQRRTIFKKRTDLMITNEFPDKQPNHYFQLSMSAMTHTRPPPYRQKRTCYDDRCRLLDNLKRFSIESIKMEPAKEGSMLSTTMGQTLNKTYFQKRLREQSSFTSQS